MRASLARHLILISSSRIFCPFFVAWSKACFKITEGGPFEQLFHHVAGKKPMLLLVSGSAQDTLQNTAHILHPRVLYHQEWEGGNT